MRSHETQPLQARNLLDSCHERRQPPVAVRIAVIVHVLAQEHDLFRSRIDRLAALPDNGGQRDVPLTPSYPWHDAKRAVVVATLDDSHEVADACASGGWQRLTLRIVVAGIQAGDEVVVVA